MKAARFAVAALTVVAGAVAAYYFCVLPYRCNRLRAVQTATLAAAFRNSGSADAKIAARRNLDVLWPCGGPTCRDVGIDMLLAASYRILGQEREATRRYRDALRLDRRPEIFTNLALTELAMGDRNAAREDFLRAALFNPWMLQAIEDGLMRREVVQGMIELRPEDADYIRYVDSVVLP